MLLGQGNIKLGKALACNLVLREAKDLAKS